MGQNPGSSRPFAMLHWLAACVGAGVAAACHALIAVLGVARTLLVDLLVVAAIVLVVMIVYREVGRPDTVIEEIAIPPELARLGYSGHVASMRLVDAVNELNSEARRMTDLDKSTVINQAKPQFDLVEPQSGLSLRTISNAIDTLFPGRKRRVGGEFLCTDATCTVEKMQLRLRVSQGDNLEIASAGKIGEVSDENVEAYFRKSAVELLKILDPIVIAERLAASGASEAEFGDPEGVRLEAMRISKALVRRHHADDARAAALLGGIYAGMGDPALAAHYFAMVDQRAEPRERALVGTALYLWGNMLWATDPEGAELKFTQAKTIFAEEAEADRLDASYLCWRAYTLEALGDDKGAATVYEEWVARRPEDAHAHIFYGLVMARLARGNGETVDMEAPIARIEEALDIDPKSFRANNEIGHLLIETDRPAAAIGRYADAVRQAPDDAILQSNLGYAIQVSMKKSGDEACIAIAGEEREGLPGQLVKGFWSLTQTCAAP